MFSHIYATTVYVADQDAALDFYVNTLGWEKSEDAEVGEGARWLTVVPPGATTQLVLAAAEGRGAGDGESRDSGMTLVAPDIDATDATLTARGVRFKQPVTVMPGARRRRGSTISTGTNSSWSPGSDRPNRRARFDYQRRTTRAEEV